MKIYNRNTIKELVRRGYHNRHIAIVMNCNENTVAAIKKELDIFEPTLRFMSTDEKQRLFVLDKFLNLRPVEQKWGSNDYYYITILKFLLVSREQICSIYRAAPAIQVSRAYKEKAPKFKLFDYTTLQINSEEYQNFVRACYTIINDPTKWK